MSSDSRDQTLADADARQRRSYDRLPYLSEPQLHTHPDRLATLGRLAGLETASPGACRLLEIGCGDGGNLLAMAWHSRGSQFVGIDLSPVQVETGRRHARALGLDNVELRVESVLEMADDGAPFDFIVAHGVFSWVEEDVRERILALASTALAPQGVALVSYNVLPGWHLRRFVRDLMLHHTRELEDPLDKVRQGVGHVDLLAERMGERSDEQAALLRAARRHLAELRDRPDHIFHDYFAERNDAFYFEDFLARAEAHGLQYLGDAEREVAQLAQVDPVIAGRLAPLEEDRAHFEQSLDFVINRSFRRSLLCRAGHALDHPPPAERVMGLWAASAVEPMGDEHDLASSARLEFRLDEGRSFSTSHPLAKAVLVTLAEAWPTALDFETLVSRVVDGLGQRAASGNGGRRGDPRDSPEPEIDTEVVADILCSSFFSGVVDLHCEARHCAHRAGDKPRVFELARYQLEQGRRVSNERHGIVELDDPAIRLLVRLLDGRRDRSAVIELLVAEAEAGRLRLELGGSQVRDPQRRRRLLVSLLDEQLERLARLALLEPEPSLAPNPPAGLG